MKVAVFSTKPYDRAFLSAANATHQHELTFLQPGLSTATALLAEGHEAVCVFVNDCVDAEVAARLAATGVRVVALRCAGFNQVNLEAARSHDLTIVRVSDYSPHAVAEHAVSLILALNRKLYRAYNRVRDDNFALDGLMGFDLYGCTIGVVGTGKIGACFAQIMMGFGCRIVAYDPYPNPECVAIGVEYLPLNELLALCDVVSLHCPLTADNHHLINAQTLTRFKPGAMLINTSRGGLVDSNATIEALKSGRLGYLGLDVYEGEGPLFFEDRSDTVIQDDTFQRLQSFPNVMITAHQAFFTREAMTKIAQITLQNLSDIAIGNPCPNCL